MLRYIWHYWSKKPLGVTLISLGYVIGILLISLGISLAVSNRQNLEDRVLGNPNNYFNLDITFKQYISDYTRFIELTNFLSSFGETYITNLGKIETEINSTKQSYNTIFLTFKDKPDWNLPILEGNYFSVSEIKNNEYVVVVGKNIASKYNLKPHHSKIKVGNDEYKVIGICGRQYKSAQWDDSIYIPLQVVSSTLLEEIPHRIYNKNEKNHKISLYIRNSKVNCQGSLEENSRKIFKGITLLFDYPVKDNSFNSSFEEEIARTTILGAAVMIVSLVNVMNLSLFWVFDRRKEFALMKALGSKDRYISLWVIFEMILVSFASSLIGILIHAVLWYLFGGLIASMGYYLEISYYNIIVVVAVGMFCGIATSLLPVIMTLKISPSRALRS